MQSSFADTILFDELNSNPLLQRKLPDLVEVILILKIFNVTSFIKTGVYEMCRHLAKCPLREDLFALILRFCTIIYFCNVMSVSQTWLFYSFGNGKIDFQC